MDSVFVGNPLFGEMDVASRRAKTYAGFESRNLKLALMPGSRAAEIESLWRPMQQIALRLKQKYPAASFVTVAVDAEREQILRAAQIPGFQCRYDIGTVSDTARACDFAIVASGSATLEVAAAGCPMVIMYQSSRLLWHLIGRWMVKTEYLSLVNILSSRGLVPEFMPYFTSVEPIVGTIERLLDDKNKLAQISGELIGLIGPLAEKKAGEEVAKIVVEMLT
jgi:lipid-A-disaccharide synthase